MRFTIWLRKVKELEEAAETARLAYENACTKRDDLIERGTGVRPGQMATVVGTATMVANVLRMLNASPGDAVDD